jgi:2-keto-4-pentenoate hydratase/2-oxohepta-3-ene-1,7-dioic acid hydratase in catechol pathway
VRETGKQVTESPVLFLRTRDCSWPMARTSCAARSQRLDYEGEIAVIIGRGGRRIREADA